MRKDNNIENWGNEKEEYKIIYKYNDIDSEKEEDITLNTEITTKLENENNAHNDNVVLSHDQAYVQNSKQDDHQNHINPFQQHLFLNQHSDK